MREGPEPLRDVLRRQAVTVAKGIALAPVAVLLVMVPGGLAVVVAQWAVSTDSVVLETAVSAVLMAATFTGLWWAFAYGGIASLLSFGRFEPTLRASALAFFALASFASLTSLLYKEDLVQTSVPPAPGQDILDVSLEFYAWQFANILPLVDVPGNLDWAKPFEFTDRLGGLLVIVFTGFVIFPLIQAARLILAGSQVPYDVTVTRALGKVVGERRIHTVRHRWGYGRALVDDRVIVDVIPQLWNHDPVLPRLDRMCAQPDENRPAGYLLVVDAIGDRARDRVEDALKRAPFPARLAVWRADEHERDLIASFEALREEIPDD